jgi:RNA polymerase sigma-70 factor (ECF subfamily)
LKADDRMALELVHLEGYSNREAAQLLGWSQAKMKMRAFRAKKRLRHLLHTLLCHRGENDDR